MRRRALSIFAALASLAACAVWPQAEAQEGGPAEAACASQSVLLLLDESGSLRTLDPDSQRVGAAQLLVDALELSARRGDGIELTIAGFGSVYTEYGRYALPADTSRARDEVERFRDRNRQRNTDYVLALRSAAAHFAAVQLPLECKSLVWFTDGVHDIEFPAESSASQYINVPPSPSREDGMRITQHLMGLVCAPLPSDAVITTPVRDEVVRANFQTRFSELRVSTSNPRTEDLRAITDPVLAALFGASDGPCSIPGSRSVVNDAGELAGSFFEQAQEATGATPMLCSALSDGTLRSDVVESVAFRSSAPSPPPRMVVGEAVVDLPGRFVDVTVPPELRPAAEPVIVDTRGAEIFDCYVGVEAVVSLREAPNIYRGASATTVELVVRGSTAATERSVGRGLVELRASVDGAPVDAVWDEELGAWVVSVSPTASDEVGLHAEGFVPGTDTLFASVAPLDEALVVSDVPPTPTASWVGDVAFEGAGQIGGTVRFTPRATVPGATFCVTPSSGRHPLVDSAGEQLGGLVIDESAGDLCFPADTEVPFDVPAHIEVTEDRNATGRVAFEYGASFDDGASVRDLGAESVEIASITLTRPPDRGREVAIVAALVAATILLPLVFLWLLNARQSRLPSPDRYFVASTDALVAPAAAPAGGLTATRRSSEPLRMEHLRPVRGSRNEYDLYDGALLKRRRPMNPFGTPTAELVVDGEVAATIGNKAGRSGRWRTPVRFNSFGVLAVRRASGTKADDGVPGRAWLVIERRTTAEAATCQLDEALLRMARRLDLQPGRDAPTATPTPDGRRPPESTPPRPPSSVASPQAAEPRGPSAPPSAPSRTAGQPVDSGRRPPPAPPR